MKVYLYDKMMIENEYGVFILKRVFHAMLFALCFLSLLGCSDTAKDALYALPVDASDIEDFKCVCSTDEETEFIIDNNYAKELYRYITSQWQKAKETELVRTEQRSIYLSFQDGEPLLTLNQEPKAETSNTLAVSEQHFYGVFWICENDYLVFTATPMTSFQKYYTLPEGTYNKVLEMVTQ